MKFDDNSLYNIKSSVDGKRYSLFELATWKNGLAFKKINFCETGVPVIKIAELNNGIGGTTAYTQQTFSEDFHLCKGDLLFSWSGNPQTSIDIFRFNLDEGWLNQHIFKVTPDEKTVNRDYFYFLMKNLKPHFTQIATNKQTTGLGHVTIADIKRMSVVIPSLDVQRNIVSYIKPIDDKIELNNEINNNLEQQAQAIYKAWFVDFSAFGGTAPNDWQTYHLVDFLPVITGKKNANVSSNQGKYPFFSCSQDYAWTDDYSFDGSAILVAGNGDFNVKFYSGKFEAYQRTYVLIPYEPKYTAWLFYAVQYHLSSITSAARGSVIKFITKGNLEDFEFVAPKVPLSLPIIYNLDTINRKIAANREENLRLGTLRDMLLPKLMSGELNVSNIGI